MTDEHHKPGIIPLDKFKPSPTEHITFHSSTSSGQRLRFEVINDTECMLIAEMKSFPGYLKGGVAPIYGVNPDGWFNLSLEGDVIIPAEVEFDGKTYKITKIDSFAFKNCPNLTAVEIPYGVKRIVPKTFMNNGRLTKVRISKVTIIENDAVINCPDLQFETFRN